MNEKIEQYIKGLPPELQEKARQCETMEELNDFIAENDIEIPEEALEQVAGGCGEKLYCIDCGSESIGKTTKWSTYETEYFCNKCKSKNIGKH